MTEYPLSTQFELPEIAPRIEAVQQELSVRAAQDANRCFGYFPSMKNARGIESNLPHSEKLAAIFPEIQLEGKTLAFNFLRLSLIQQTGDSPFHLDSDAATALTGDPTTAHQRRVWRLLLNLHETEPRRFSYLNAAPTSLPLAIEGGYVHCDNQHILPEMIETIAVPPREGNRVHGLLFCASQLLHTGQDDEAGHFVASYGCEEI